MNEKQIKLVLNLDKSHNHYDFTEDEIYKTIKTSLRELDNFYSRLDELSEVYDEEKNSLYKITDIFWNVELDRDSNKTSFKGIEDEGSSNE